MCRRKTHPDWCALFRYEALNRRGRQASRSLGQLLVSPQAVPLNGWACCRTLVPFPSTIARTKSFGRYSILPLTSINNSLVRVIGQGSTGTGGWDRGPRYLGGGPLGFCPKGESRKLERENETRRQKGERVANVWRKKRVVSSRAHESRTAAGKSKELGCVQALSQAIAWT